jgi:nicotinamidase/pyrazinamidase
MLDRVFIDIDTQVDFLYPAGTLYVPGAEKIIVPLARLYAAARERGVPVIASADAHREQDPEFAAWPPHCVAGTLGQGKVPETLLAGAVAIPNRAGPGPAGWEQAPQVIIEKQTLDVFDTATIQTALDARPASRYTVFGVVTEICVAHALRGLVDRFGGAKIELVSDAVAALDPQQGQQVFEWLVAAGGRLTTVSQIVAD